MAVIEINYETLGRKVAELYPDIAKQLHVKPDLNDLSIIQQIFDSRFKDNPDTNKRFIFIGVVLSLYDPDILRGWKQYLNRGIRRELSSICGVSETAISHNLQTVKDYYNIYVTFKKSVDYISALIKEEYASKEC